VPTLVVVKHADWDSHIDPVPYYGSGDDIEELCYDERHKHTAPRSKLSLNTVREIDGCSGIGGSLHMVVCDMAD